MFVMGMQVLGFLRTKVLTTNLFGFFVRSARISEEFLRTKVLTTNLFVL